MNGDVMKSVGISDGMFMQTDLMGFKGESNLISRSSCGSENGACGLHDYNRLSRILGSAVSFIGGYITSYSHIVIPQLYIISPVI